MLTQFRFENFKSWRDTGEIRMAPLTGIFGTNSSGKTAILQFLLMLKQTVESSDQKLILNLGNYHAYVNLGTSFDILNQHILPGEIKFHITWLPDHKYFKRVFLPSKYPSNDISVDKHKLAVFEEYRSWIDFSSTILFNPNEIIPKKSCYQFEDERNNIQKSIYEIEEDSGNIFFEGRLLENLNLFYSNQDETSVNNSFRDSTNADKFYRSLVSSLSISFEEQCEKIFYLGPLREYPQRFYLWSGEQPQDVGKKGEFIASALLASRNNNMNVEKHVAHWLKELGLIHDFQIQPIAENRRDYEILVRRFPGSPQVLITDVGFGVSQILPVLVLCYYVPEGSTIIFEQPEIHLHPSVQAGLADVFIDVIKTRNVQIILESHSEHLLRRLQRRIAEEYNHMTAEDAALYFCSIDDTGTSKLTSLELDTYGNINNWPQDFFGDEMGDLVAMTEAAMRRQMTKS